MRAPRVWCTRELNWHPSAVSPSTRSFAAPSLLLFHSDCVCQGVLISCAISCRTLVSQRCCHRLSQEQQFLCWSGCMEACQHQRAESRCLPTTGCIHLLHSVPLTCGPASLVRDKKIKTHIQPFRAPLPPYSAQCAHNACVSTVTCCFKSAVKAPAHARTHTHTHAHTCTRTVSTP